MLTKVRCRGRKRWAARVYFRREFFSDGAKILSDEGQGLVVRRERGIKIWLFPVILNYGVKNSAVPISTDHYIKITRIGTLYWLFNWNWNILERCSWNLGGYFLILHLTLFTPEIGSRPIKIIFYSFFHGSWKYE